MTQEELRQYILDHRDDEDAVHDAVLRIQRDGKEATVDELVEVVHQRLAEKRSLGDTKSCQNLDFMEPTIEQLKSLYRVVVNVSNLLQPINLVRLDGRTKRIYILIGDSNQVEIYQNGGIFYI